MLGASSVACTIGDVTHMGSRLLRSSDLTLVGWLAVIGAVWYLDVFWPNPAVVTFRYPIDDISSLGELGMAFIVNCFR